MGILYSDSLSRRSSSGFFDSLTGCLYTVTSSVKQLAQLPLMHTVSPDSEDTKRDCDIQTQDSLLVYRGAPLVAVMIQVHGSQVVRSVKEPKAQEAAASVAAVRDMRQGLAERLQAADADVTPPPPPPPRRVVKELEWRITLRMPPGGESIFCGGPFDFDQIENAFDAIVGIVELAIKTAKAPVLTTTGGPPTIVPIGT
jgi:hypothetical protein